MKEKLIIRFITPCAGEGFFLPVKKGMKDAGLLTNAECSFIGTDDVDLPAQIAMVESAIQDGVDGIALSIADPDAFTEAIHHADRNGIPVVAFNMDASNGMAGSLGAVRQDVYQAGRALGARALEHIAAGARILSTVHSDGIPALEKRLKGIHELLAPRMPDWKVITTGMVPETAAERISAELSADPAISAVLCTGQADTEGAGLAAARLPAGRRPYVAGFDLSPRILQLVEQGVIRFTIDQQPYLQGFLPVIQLVLYVRYGIRPSIVDAGAAIIDATSANRVLELCRDGYR